MRVLKSWIAAAALAAAPCCGAEPAAGPPASNPEMTKLFEADQAPRLSGKPINWGVGARTASAKARTKTLLDSGALATGEDYEHAAFIFQHGETPDDYLMAHTLATIAAAKGRSKAAWIAAASLDRYLMAIGRRQIYGTRYKTRDKVATQEPYDRKLISDSVRRALGVDTQAEQAVRLKDFARRWKKP